jgi:hypothetical protein
MDNVDLRFITMPIIGNNPGNKQRMAADLVDLIDFHFPDPGRGGWNRNEKASR